MSTELAKTKKIKELIPEVYRPVFGAAIFFVLMMVAFIVSAPEVFLTVGIYTAIFLSLPLFTIVGLSLVYITAAGEMIFLSIDYCYKCPGLYLDATTNADEFWPRNSCFAPDWLCLRLGQWLTCDSLRTLLADHNIRYELRTSWADQHSQ
jgi:hypothetical protein